MSTNNYKCFFISPIGGAQSDERRNSDRVKNLLLVPALAQCGFSPENIVRSDLLASTETYKEMMQHLEEDELCVVDLSGLNPNVMYEYGYRRGLGKSFIVLAPENQTLPFDVLYNRVIFYDLQSEHALEKLTGTVEKICDQVKNRIDSGFFESSGASSVKDISDRLNRIERRLVEVLSNMGTDKGSYTYSNTAQDMVRELGSPISAFNYALRNRDTSLAESLLPLLKDVLSKDRYIDQAVAQAAAMGSKVAGNILKSEWDYIRNSLTIQQQYEELGSYVSYCNRYDLEEEELDFVNNEANRLLATKEISDRQKAGIYNQLNRLNYGIYQGKKKNGADGKIYLTEALNNLQKAIDLTPNEPSFYYNLALCLKEAGRSSDAVKAIQNCLENGTDDADHLTTAYELYKDENMISEAQDVKRKLMSISPIRAGMLN